MPDAGRGAQSLVDLTGVFRVWNPRFKSWSVFSQDHLARVLLDWGPDATGHNAVLDAVKSVRLFNLYSQLQASPEEWQAAQARARLRAATSWLIIARGDTRRNIMQLCQDLHSLHCICSLLFLRHA